MPLNRKSLLAVALGMGLAACGEAPSPETAGAEAPGATEGIAAAEQSAALPAERGEEAAPASAEEAGFDITTVPVSEVALGDFPYLRLPTGYVFTNREGSDYDRVAFWTGDRIEWVEGRVFGAQVRGDKDVGKTFALLEYQRNIQAAVRQAGGQAVAEGRWPRALRDELKATDPQLGVRFNSGLGDIWNNPVETFVVRRPDREIWIQISGNELSGSLLVAETAQLEITAGLLEASELKRQIDADGRVAIEVNFALDSADILPGSQPQIDQVLALLREDPALRLSIDGHTDATGDGAHNQRLSEARAKSVVAALTGQGIEASRLEAKGHGQSQPVADNATDEGRAKNRRVELVRLG